MPSPNASRARRSEDEMISDLEAKISEVESRMKRKEQRDQPVHRSFAKFKKQASAFAQTALDDQRTDVANTVIGMLGVVQRQLGDD
ncbi:MAG: hypothetical protein P8R43_04875 [Planctomycetota bacterium]|nr:hypothetical protein [Planctomycetota bacterium]